MAALSLSIDAIRPLNRWDYDRIQPGPVGSVGDVICQSRLKHSAPELPLRFSEWNAGKNEVFLGSNVSDGQHVGYDSGGGPARLIDSNWGGRRSFKTRLGYILQDIREPDNAVEPFVSSLGDYSWRNKIATTYEARRTGENFLPLPGGYQLSPGEVPRGGQTPRVTDEVGGDALRDVASIVGYGGDQRYNAGPSRLGVQRHDRGGQATQANQTVGMNNAGPSRIGLQSFGQSAPYW